MSECGIVIFSPPRTIGQLVRLAERTPVQVNRVVLLSHEVVADAADVAEEEAAILALHLVAVPVVRLQDSELAVFCRAFAR